MTPSRRHAPAFFMVCQSLLCSMAAAQGMAEPDGYLQGGADAATPSTLHGGTVIHAQDLEALLRQGRTVVVDVSNTPRRPPELAPGAPWMPLPHPALPHALWFPGAGAAVLSPEFDAFFRSRLTSAADGSLDAPVVVYCHDKCGLSWNAAKRAIGYGFRRVYWFPEGIEGWTAAGQETAAAQPLTPDAELPKLVILNLELSGDLGGPDFLEQHTARLKTESARLRRALEGTRRYVILDNAPAQDMINTLTSRQAYLHDCNGCDLDVGRALHADQVFVAWVDRVSGLILSLTYEIHDVRTGQIIARKSFDFRGDNDNAWNHAIDYMVRHLTD